MKETDIRPRALFDDFLAIAARDLERFFSDRREFVAVGCPACADSRAEQSFVKNGFRYCVCPACGSLFVSPRPTSATIATFYRESETLRFWAERFFPETVDARRQSIFRPRARMIADLVCRLGVPTPSVLVDIGAGYGTFLEEVSTPGDLDVDIVRTMLETDPALSLPRFARYLLEHRGADAWSDFQAFLQRHQLSLHVRVTARVPAGG